MSNNVMRSVFAQFILKSNWFEIQIQIFDSI